MSGYVQISYTGSLFFCSHKFLLWRTFGGQNVKLEDLEDKLANWRTSFELEDTCALWSYASKFSLDYHSKSHKEPTEKPACEHCGKTFASFGNLSCHKNIVHKTDDLPQKYSVAVRVKCNAVFIEI